MARPNKQGLDYFPFDTDFFSDEKIEAISGEFGIKGEITAIKLLCAIYRNGYFILWDELLKMKLLNNLPGISSELLDRIVYRLVSWGFFDMTLFDSVKVLTSIGIQKRFFEITKRRKTEGDYPYLLVNVCNNGVNVDRNPGSKGVNVNINPTKESKVKNIKETTTNVVAKKAVTIVPDMNEHSCEKIKTWRDDYDTYLDLVRDAYKSILSDKALQEKQQRYYPGVDIILSIEKACTNYWATEAGWKKKKSARSKDIDMKMTLINAININKVYYGQTTETTKRYDNGDFLR